MKIWNLILSIIIVLVSAVLCQQIIKKSISNQKNKYDYAELNHIKYGLLSYSGPQFSDSELRG